MFRALVRDMSLQVRDTVAPSLDGAVDALDAERRALASFLRFVRGHKQVYRIIDEGVFTICRNVCDSLELRADHDRQTILQGRQEVMDIEAGNKVKA